MKPVLASVRCSSHTYRRSKRTTMSVKKLERKGTSNGNAIDSLSAATPPLKQIESWSEVIRAWPKTTFCIVTTELCERLSFYGMRTVLTLYLMNVLKFSGNLSTVFFNGFTALYFTTPLIGSLLADGYIGKFKLTDALSIFVNANVDLNSSSVKSNLYFWVLCCVGIHAFPVIHLGGMRRNSLLQTIVGDRAIPHFPPLGNTILDMAGLLIIAFGTGGIKPCVSAFGGDQFELGQVRMISIWFSMYYFSINLGSMVSSFVSPIFRSQSCFGQDSCYPLAFGVPAGLMIAAIVIFLSGSFWYKKQPPKENIFAEVFRVIKQALANKRFFNVKRDHWLDHYLDSHSCEYDEKCLVLIKTGRGRRSACQKREFVQDIKNLFRVMIMLLPVPMYAALYDQQGSRWLIQSLAMDCKLWGNVMLLPDQMQALNAVLILVLIPFSQVVIYPIIGKCFKITHLRKMVCGGFLTCAAFVISAAVQLRVNTTLPDIPQENQAFLSFANTLQNCSITVTPPDTLAHSLKAFYLPPNTTMFDDKTRSIQEVYRVPSGQPLNWTISTNCTTSPWGSSFMYTNHALKSKTSFYVVVGTHGAYMAEANWRKPTEGNGEFSLSINLAMDNSYVGNLALCRSSDKAKNPDFPCDPKNSDNFNYWQLDYNDGTTDFGTNPNDDKPDNRTISWSGPNNGHTTPQVSAYIYKPVRPGSWDLYFMSKRAKDVDHKTPDRTDLPVNYTGISFEIEEQGAVYTLIVTSEGNKTVKSIYQIVPHNQVSILWQIPQITVLTIAEIFFSITGYEFAYSQILVPSLALWLPAGMIANLGIAQLQELKRMAFFRQAAPSMKAIVQALWLLTSAIGDSIIVLITLLNLFDNMAIELLFYAGVMFIVIVIFALIAIFYYEYNDYTTGEANHSGFEEDIDEKHKY